MSDLTSKIEAFLAGSPFAVAGASRDRDKYGNKVLRCYMQHGRAVHPVNPRETEIEGLPAYPDLAALPELPHGVSLITPPPVTRKIVEAALALGIANFWMQPGAEDDAAVRAAEAVGANVIHGGPCVLVVLGFHDV